MLRDPDLLILKNASLVMVPVPFKNYAAQNMKISPSNGERSLHYERAAYYIGIRVLYRVYLHNMVFLLHQAKAKAYAPDY
jgi:hypothetical protein